MLRTRDLLIIALETIALGLFSGPAFAAGQKDYKYLALGDSIPFGMDPRLVMAGQPRPAPSDFKGYPELLSLIDARYKDEVNGSCPGETSSSFLMGPPDNGCNSMGPTGQGPFKPVVGLHVDYSGTQMAFAVSELAANKHIKLVTLSIGANDVLLAVAYCQIAGGDVPACIGRQLPITLGMFAQNLARILTAIRANYDGTLVLVNYYSPSPDLNGVVLPLNQTIADVGAQFGAKIADGYAAFQLVAALHGGDVCQAGLLIPAGPGTCDQHPTSAGQAVLAAAVEVAIKQK
jgi:lysophospholipase L1-like esterase